MNTILQTLTEEQCKAIDWMIENNFQSYLDGVKQNIGAEYDTIFGEMLRRNGLKIV